jgi:hypothetical protein
VAASWYPTKRITMTSETPEAHKLRAVRLTAACRFSAAERLRRHERYSLFSITMCSLAVVLVSLMEPFGMQLGVPSNVVNLVCAALSLLILVVSLLVSGNKYGERAEKMHAGAIEINSVARKLESAISRGDDIEPITEVYENILKIYENHRAVDFRVAQAKRYADHYKIDIWHRLWTKILLVSDVIPQLIPLLIVVGLIAIVIKDARLF